MSSSEIRQAFNEYFNELGHEVVPSAPLPVPENPTLLFTNAGMNQFADVFLGKEKRSYSRATTSQKCMRVSGKHNDLENVGPSPRHHTFFEMLGNFSFGDYFKEQAIDFAWNFLTQVLGLEPERLYATVYLDDDEAFELWQKYLPVDKIHRFGKKDNYWEMGDVGPNGPCSEVHYYQGDLDNVDLSLLNNDDDEQEQFLEIWNLVFMQFDRGATGELKPLPRPSIDTGMGLERLTRILQRARSNYDTDIFMPAMDAVQRLTGDSNSEREANYVSYRVIADHGRAATFLVGDGIIPGNTGEAYVLRMIIRRAVRFGRKIGLHQPFLAAIADVYIDSMGDSYPDIKQRAEFIKRTLTLEEQRFARTLDRALQLLDLTMDELRQQQRDAIPGDIAFQLKATYGLPIEITRDIAGENGFAVDERGFQRAAQAHAEASGAGNFGEYDEADQLYATAFEQLVAHGTLDGSGVDYDPYSGHELDTLVIGLFRDGQIVESGAKGQQVELLTKATPFYLEAGGEVSDSGWVETASGRGTVEDIIRKGGLILHSVNVTDGAIAVGDIVTLRVDNERRQAIRRNHTATHLLHAALRQTLGNHVTQQGSLVAPDRLRFDFSHSEALTADQRVQLERIVNEAILANYAVQAEFLPRDEAIRSGAMALFGEKYGEIVRTIKVGDDYSVELCGGLHVARTGDIGAFYFTSEGSVSAGIRRVEAVTGRAALEFVSGRLQILSEIAERLNVAVHEMPARIDGLLDDSRRLQREGDELRRTLARAQFNKLLGELQSIDDLNLLVGQVENLTIDAMREMTDWFDNQVDQGVIVLASVQNDRPLFIARVAKPLVKRGVRAGDIVREMGKITGGGGGGRPDMAQAGGRDAGKLSEALARVPVLIKAALNGSP